MECFDGGPIAQVPGFSIGAKLGVHHPDRSLSASAVKYPQRPSTKMCPVSV